MLSTPNKTSAAKPPRAPVGRAPAGRLSLDAPPSMGTSPEGLSRRELNNIARAERVKSRSESKLASPSVEKVSDSGAPLLSAAALSEALEKAAVSTERRSVSPPRTRPTSPPLMEGDMDNETFAPESAAALALAARRTFSRSMMVLGAPMDHRPESPENWREMYAAAKVDAAPLAVDGVMADAPSSDSSVSSPPGSDDDEGSDVESEDSWDSESESGEAVAEQEMAVAEQEMADAAQEAAGAAQEEVEMAVAAPVAAEVEMADAAPEVAVAAPVAAEVQAAVAAPAGVVEFVDLTDMNDEVVVKTEKGASETAITSQNKKVIADIRKLMGMIESASSEHEKTIFRELLAQVSAAAGAAAAGAAAAGAADGGAADGGSAADGSSPGKGSKAGGSKAGGSRAGGSKVDALLPTIKYSQEEFLKFS